MNKKIPRVLIMHDRPATIEGVIKFIQRKTGDILIDATSSFDFEDRILETYGNGDSYDGIICDWHNERSNALRYLKALADLHHTEFPDTALPEVYVMTGSPEEDHPGIHGLVIGHTPFEKPTVDHSSPFTINEFIDTINSRFAPAIFLVNDSDSDIRNNKANIAKIAPDIVVQSCGSRSFGMIIQEHFKDSKASDLYVFDWNNDIGDGPELLYKMRRAHEQFAPDTPFPKVVFHTGAGDDELYMLDSQLRGIGFDGSIPIYNNGHRPYQLKAFYHDICAMVRPEQSVRVMVVDDRKASRESVQICMSKFNPALQISTCDTHDFMEDIDKQLRSVQACDLYLFDWVGDHMDARNMLDALLAAHRQATPHKPLPKVAIYTGAYGKELEEIFKTLQAMPLFAQTPVLSGMDFYAELVKLNAALGKLLMPSDDQVSAGGRRTPCVMIVDDEEEQHARYKKSMEGLELITTTPHDFVCLLEKVLQTGKRVDAIAFDVYGRWDTTPELDEQLRALVAVQQENPQLTFPKVIFFSGMGQEATQSIAGCKQSDPQYQNLSIIGGASKLQLGYFYNLANLAAGNNTDKEILRKKPLPPCVMVVDDDEEEHLRFKRNTHGVQVITTTPHDFSGRLESRLMTNNHVHAIAFDCLNVDEYSPSLEVQLAELAALKKDYSFSEFPDVIILSGYSQEKIDQIVKTCRSYKGCEELTFIGGARIAPLDDFYNLVRRAAGIVEPENEQEQLSLLDQDVSLDEMLSSFRAMKASQFMLAESRRAEAAFIDRLSRMPSQEMLRPFRETVQHEGEYGFLEFESAVGPSLHGTVVFSPEKALALAGQYPTASIILAQNSGSMALGNWLDSHRDVVKGVAIVGKSASHFGQIARKYGISALMIDAERAKQMGLDFCHPLSYIENNRVCINDADAVTFDTNAARMYRGTKPISPAALTAPYVDFSSYADVLLRDLRRRSVSQPVSPMIVSVQADAPFDCPESRLPTLGLVRSENFFLGAERRQAVLSAFRNPSPSNLGLVQEITKASMDELFNGKEADFVTLRLFDTKPDQLFESAEEAEAFANEVGYGSSIIRGFALSLTRPEVYEAIMKGALDAFFSKEQMAHQALRSIEFAVPCAQSHRDIQRAKAMVNNVWPKGLGRDVYVGAFIESRHGVGNVKSIARECATLDSKTIASSITLGIGSGDMMEQICGCSRTDDAAITAWCNKDGSRRPHPFRKMTSELQEWLTYIAAEVKGVDRTTVHLKVCGPQVTDFDFWVQAGKLGVRECCVPPDPLYTKGFPQAYRTYALKQMLPPAGQPLPLVMR